MQVEHKEKFSTSSPFKSIISDLRLPKHKTTKVFPFEAHFGRSAKTLLKKISTAPSSLNLTYEKFINFYIDADTVPAEDLLDDAGWVNPDRSDLEIEKTICQAQKYEGRQYRASTDKESCFIIQPKLTNPIPRT